MVHPQVSWRTTISAERHCKGPSCKTTQAINTARYSPLSADLPL